MADKEEESDEDFAMRMALQAEDQRLLKSLAAEDDGGQDRYEDLFGKKFSTVQLDTPMDTYFNRATQNIQSQYIQPGIVPTVQPVKKVIATVYVEVVPTFKRQWNGVTGSYDDVVDTIKVARTWQAKPKASTTGIIMKLQLQFPEPVFLPLQLSATVDIPASMVDIPQTVVVEALDSNDRGVAEHLAAQWNAANP